MEEESLREATRRFRSGRGSDLSAEELARIARRVQELKRERRAVVLAHYYVPAETQALLHRHPDGTLWAHTGDMGHMDQDGFVYVDSRIKRMIIRPDGYKVFPSLIENVISRHPAVHQCSVVSCPDQEHTQGRLPFVFVVLDSTADKKKRQILRELRQLCREELPEYVQPVGYKFLPELPLTPVGKVDYRTLEEQISPRDY